MINLINLIKESGTGDIVKGGPAPSPQNILEFQNGGL